MLNELTTSVRRWTGFPAATAVERVPLVRLRATTDDPVHLAQIDIGTLRGVTSASADTAECNCPEPCERDHANE